jgi:hypothetical protein
LGILYLLKGPNEHPNNPGSGILARIPGIHILDELNIKKLELVADLPVGSEILVEYVRKKVKGSAHLKTEALEKVGSASRGGVLMSSSTTQIGSPSH